jgi:hypothetical protein
LKTAVAHVFVINVSNRCCLQAERTSRHIGWNPLSHPSHGHVAFCSYCRRCGEVLSVRLNLTARGCKGTNAFSQLLRYKRTLWCSVRG